MAGPARGADTVTVSLWHGLTDDDITYVLDTLPPIANRLLEMSPFYEG